jgi:hypothetical protein
MDTRVLSSHRHLVVIWPVIHVIVAHSHHLCRHWQHSLGPRARGRNFAQTIVPKNGGWRPPHILHHPWMHEFSTTFHAWEVVHADAVTAIRAHPSVLQLSRGFPCS